VAVVEEDVGKGSDLITLEGSKEEHQAAAVVVVVDTNMLL
jgi:hypothetical protein